jgi:hypothetical protein
MSERLYGGSDDCSGGWPVVVVAVAEAAPMRTTQMIHGVADDPMTVERTYFRPGETQPTMSLKIGGLVEGITLFFDSPEQLMRWAADVASKCRQAAAETPRGA